jgi:hypothetical protein
MDAKRSRFGAGAAAFLGVAVLLSACASGRPPSAANAERARGEEREREALARDYQRLQDQYRQLQEKSAQLENEYRLLSDQSKKQATANEQQQERLARLQLQLWEKELQVKLLTEKLEAAIVEVVRAMAKLRGMESRAEAASNLAEAEVALNLLQRRGAGSERGGEVRQAQQLLRMAAEEFKKENYGGTLYLANQAKALIKGGQVQTGSPESPPMLEGELSFSLPVPLKALAKSNVREGPGASSKVVYVVEAGARLTGHSYRAPWVRVRSDDGRWGWIFYNLIGPP